MINTQGTRQDTEYAIVTAIEAGDVDDAYAEFDVAAIADAVYDAAGEWDTEALDHDAFWRIVERHALSLAQKVAAADLPDGVHAAVSEVHQPYHQEAVIVWADRADGTCGRCGEDIGVEVEQPAILGQQGDWEPFSQQHGCGEWNAPDWRTLGDDATTAEVEELAESIAADRHSAGEDSFDAIGRDRADFRTLAAGSASGLVAEHIEYPVAADTTDEEILRLCNQAADWLLEQADDSGLPQDPRAVELREDRGEVVERAAAWLRGVRDDLADEQ